MIIEIAKYLKEVRIKLGLTQKQMAERVGVKRYNWAKYETGTKPPYDVFFKARELDPDHTKDI